MENLAFKAIRGTWRLNDGTEHADSITQGVSSRAVLAQPYCNTGTAMSSPRKYGKVQAPGIPAAATGYVPTTTNQRMGLSTQQCGQDIFLMNTSGSSFRELLHETM